MKCWRWHINFCTHSTRPRVTLAHSLTHSLTQSLTHSLAHTHTHTRIHARTHARTHTHTRAHTHTHARTHARTHAHIHTHTQTRVYTRTLTLSSHPIIKLSKRLIARTFNFHKHERVLSSTERKSRICCHCEPVQCVVSKENFVLKSA